MTTERETQLLRDAYAAGITSPRELANFMAQVGHESHGLERLDESFRYTRSAEQISGNVRSALREGRDALEAARLEALAGRPERLADLMYGGRMGNDEPGDGYRYRGRGYVQLTGRNQYEAAGKALELDLVDRPDLAAKPDHAARIATWYWQQNVPRDVRENARAAGAAINGRDPPNGLADREQRFERWVRELTPERIQSLSEGRTPVPRSDISVAATLDPTMRSTPAQQAGVLRERDRGQEVRDLQTTLTRLGIGDARGVPLDVDGRFGARTGEAVRAFQQARGLEVDGVVGPETRRTLDRAARAEPNAPVPPAPDTDPARTSPLDRLIAAARDSDPATLRAALADFTETTFGRTFQAAQTEHALELERATQAGRLQQDGAQR